MATILDEWRPGDLLIEALRVCGGVLLIGGLVRDDLIGEWRVE